MAVLRPWRLAGAVFALLLVGEITGPAAHAQAEGGERIYPRLLKSTVWVISPRGGNLYSMGTGSLLDLGLKLVLTNYHVVADKDTVTALFPTFHTGRSGHAELVAERDVYLNLFRSGGGCRGRVIARDPRRDLALIQLDTVPSGAHPVPLARQTVGPGERVHSIGNPGGSGALWVYTFGTVRQVYHKRWKCKFGEGILDLDAQVVETQSPTNQGDSGGPLVNDRGELVGVTQGSSSSAQLLSTFIEVGEVKDLLRSRKIKIALVSSGLSPRPAPGQAPAAEGDDADRGVRAERDAARKLRLAKILAGDGLQDKATARYQEIVDSFPNTKAAEEARQLLEKVKK
jgi:S1-C subfamily serine protease